MRKLANPFAVRKHARRILHQVLHERHSLETKIIFTALIVAHLIICRRFAVIKIEALNAFHVCLAVIKASTAES